MHGWPPAKGRPAFRVRPSVAWKGTAQKLTEAIDTERSNEPKGAEAKAIAVETDTVTKPTYSNEERRGLILDAIRELTSKAVAPATKDAILTKLSEYAPGLRVPNSTFSEDRYKRRRRSL
jgi:hypothetical protein